MALLSSLRYAATQLRNATKQATIVDVRLFPETETESALLSKKGKLRSTFYLSLFTNPNRLHLSVSENSDYPTETQQR